MAPQLGINQAPQDALLFDNSKSYFTNVGYVRTSNFQMELRDVTAASGANLGSTANFVIPKAGDLLGPVDLCIEFNAANNSPTAGYWGWVESLGYAMIEKVVFSVGLHEVETLTGDHLNIINELMRSDRDRYGYRSIAKTGRPLLYREYYQETIGACLVNDATGTAGSEVPKDSTSITIDNVTGNPRDFRVGDVIFSGDVVIGTITSFTPATGVPTALGVAAGTSADLGNDDPLKIKRGSNTDFFDDDVSTASYDRLIAGPGLKKDGKKLIIPLGLFFTTHPSKYFPIAAISGSNEIRIAVKFRQLNELLVHAPPWVNAGGKINTDVVPTIAAGNALTDLSFGAGNGAFKTGECKLRCHYIHVTGPEATALMNREHVRLMHMFNGNEVREIKSIKCTNGKGTNQTVSFDLNFMHPVKTLIITIRKLKEMGGATNVAIKPNGDHALNENTAAFKHYFAYHGGGVDPNVENPEHSIEEEGSSDLKKATRILTKSFKLTLNGQSRHLDGQGLDRDYLMYRLMPMLHSNTSETFRQIATSAVESAWATSRFPQNAESTGRLSRDHDLKALAECKDRKEIYVFPFALNPEGANPSGSVNFSKVSHARLDISLDGIAPDATADVSEEFQFDVYGLHYNWMALKDGRSETSFA